MLNQKVKKIEYHTKDVKFIGAIEHFNKNPDDWLTEFIDCSGAIKLFCELTDLGVSKVFVKRVTEVRSKTMADGEVINEQPRTEVECGIYLKMPAKVSKQLLIKVAALSPDEIGEIKTGNGKGLIRVWWD